MFSKIQKKNRHFFQENTKKNQTGDQGVLDNITNKTVFKILI